MTLPPPRGTPYRIGFVCLGNICRSPMADVVLTDLVDLAGLAGRVEVTSSGTGHWHVGEPMDQRAAAALVAEGYDPSSHVAQQYDESWLERDLLLVMDAQNLADVAPGGASERVRLFRSFDPLADPSEPGGLDVPDPYYEGDFEGTVAIVERTCRAILTQLQELPL